MTSLVMNLPEPQGGQPPLIFLKNLFSLVHDMSAVQRFSRLRMVHPENVLAHTGMVCVFAYAITRTLQTKAHRDLRPLDLGAVMARAVAHDMDETITGDIVRPTKYFSEVIRAELAKLEKQGVNNVAAALDTPTLVGDFDLSKKGREGYVVRVADLLAALCVVYTEVCVCGNLAMVAPAKNMKGVLLNLRNAMGNGGKFSDEETAILDLLLDEAHELLGHVLDRSSPLPSLHGDV